MNTEDVMLYGPAYSTYTRTARLTLEEKGVRYKLIEVDFLRGANRSAEHLARHPFGKVPVLAHGALMLYETIAITDYVDGTFPGISLLPRDAAGRARTFQSIGVLVSYIHGPMIGQIVVERKIKPFLGQPSGEAVVQSGVRRLRQGLAVLEAQLANSQFLDGEEISLADLYLIPMWGNFVQTPEGKGILPSLHGLDRWWKTVSTRASVLKTEPAI